MNKKSSIRLAADIGGTFTDVVLETPVGLYTAKVPTDTEQPELGVIAGVKVVFVLVYGADNVHRSLELQQVSPKLLLDD